MVRDAGPIDYSWRVCQNRLPELSGLAEVHSQLSRSKFRSPADISNGNNVPILPAYEWTLDEAMRRTSFIFTHLPNTPTSRYESTYTRLASMQLLNFMKVAPMVPQLHNRPTEASRS